MNLSILIQKLYMGLVQLQLMGIPPKIKKLSQIISEYEGFEPGMRAFRNKNPGNCRFHAGGYFLVYGVVNCDKDGFAIFSDVDRGWLYLQKMLTNWAKTTKADWTIMELMVGRINPKTGQPEGGYAPGSDNNDPVAYAKYITDHLGVDAETKLKDLLV